MHLENFFGINKGKQKDNSEYIFIIIFFYCFLPFNKLNYSNL